MNHAHLRETAQTAHSLGLKSISFLAADLSSTAFNRPAGWDLGRQADVGLTVAEVDVLGQEIERLIDEWAVTGCLLESAPELRRMSSHFHAPLVLMEPSAPPCNEPWAAA